ncbi:MAG: ScyD/ScyE family protein [Saprospiraceae bacterium]|nr:ScyD/ScyE family protein [Saprospiraceae bacterium]
MKKLHFTLLLLSILFCRISYAQVSMEVVAAGLRGPIGIELDSAGNLWIAESGSGQNDGAISVIWADGTQERVIENLPSTLDTILMETLGPDRIQHFNDRYFGVIMSGGIPEVGGSILVFERDSITQGGTPLSLNHAANSFNMEKRVLSLGFAESHGFSFVHDGSDMYIADAAADALLHRDGLTGVINIFATFPKIPNPLPFGPPVSDAVPTRIIKNPTGGFYVSQLTGFPFLDGASKVYAVDPQGQLSVVDSGLTLITDLALAPDGDGLIALQFANFRGDSMPPYVIGSAILQQLHSDGSRDTIAAGFGPSAGMAVADVNTFYVSNLFFGTVIKISLTTTAAESINKNNQSSLKVFPNPVDETLNLSWNQPKAGEVNLRIITVDGKTVAEQKLGWFNSGPQLMSLDRSKLGVEKIANQVLVVGLISDSMVYSSMIVLEK